MQSFVERDQASETTITRQLPVVNSYNEWDCLQEVIVGCIEGAAVPQLEPGVKVDMHSEHWDFFCKYGGRPYPKEWMESAGKELEEFCRVLEGEGVIVRRPDIIDFTQVYKTPDFEASGMDAIMPRDLLIVIGNEIIEAPMAWRSRYFEYRAYRSLMKEYLLKGAKWTTAPKPLMADELYDTDFASKNPEEQYALVLEKGRFVTTEFEPCFDAADITRCGRDLFVQRSQVTNKFGITWLRRHLGDEFRVHVLKFKDPNPLHIDATFVPLRPGLVLANPDRPCYQTDIFKTAGWDVVEAVQSNIPDDWKLLEGSKWLSINTLVLDPQRIIVEKQEEALQKQFKDLGFEVIPVDFRHVCTFGGSFHCVTCDVRREGKLEEYGFGDPIDE